MTFFKTLMRGRIFLVGINGGRVRIAVKSSLPSLGLRQAKSFNQQL